MSAPDASRNVRPRLLSGGRRAPPADWRAPEPEPAPVADWRERGFAAPSPFVNAMPANWAAAKNAHHHPKFLDVIHDRQRERARSLLPGELPPPQVLLEQYPLNPGSHPKAVERCARQRVLRGTIDCLENDAARGALSDRIFLRANERVLEKLAAGEFPVRKTDLHGETDLRVYVTAEDTLDCAKRLNQQYGLVPMVLNMANETHPGGGYRNGCAAQEENLFRRTDLHFRFTQDQIRGGDGPAARYTEEWRRKIAAVDHPKWEHMPTLAHPCICVRGSETRTAEGKVDGYEWYPEEEMFPFFELRAAAFDVNSNGADRELERREARRRIDAHLAKADNSQHGHNAVVLSAFGCGAFGGDPELVAEEYADAILDLTKPGTAGRGAGKLVVINFAIYYAGRGPNNYEVFKRVLGEKLNGPLGLTKRGIPI